MKKIRFQEKGQALIIIALAAVILFGFAALAIDGSMAFSDRRHAQNAADAAAMAAALAKIRGQNYVTTAQNLASSNGYNNDGTNNVVQVNNPPVSGNYTGNSEYIQVIITSNVKLTFARVLGWTQITNVVRSVTRAKIGAVGPSLSPGNAIFAGRTTGVGINFAGNANIKIIGGSACTNASAVLNASSANPLVTLDSNAVLCASGSINGQGTLSGGTKLTGAPVQTLPAVPTPDCSGLPVRTFDNATNPLNFQPGVYNTAVHITRPPGGPHSGDDEREVNFAPGMYCFNAGFNGQSGKYNGSGVMFVVNNGNFAISKTVQINLTKSTNLVDASGNQWAGMLLYMPSTNSGKIDVGGDQNGVDSLTGTVYAPTAECHIGQAKSHNVGMTGNIICYDFSLLGGNSNLTITYSEANLYHLPDPTTIELIQ